MANFYTCTLTFLAYLHYGIFLYLHNRILEYLHTCIVVYEHTGILAYLHYCKLACTSILVHCPTCTKIINYTFIICVLASIQPSTMDKVTIWDWARNILLLPQPILNANWKIPIQIPNLRSSNANNHHSPITMHYKLQQVISI